MHVLRRPRFWLIALLCAILAGATTLAIMVSTNRTEAKFKKIRFGMFWDEVESIMGPPTDDSQEDDNGVRTVGWHGYDGGFLMALKYGKVVDKDAVPTKTPWDRLRAMYVQHVPSRERRGVAFP